MEPVPPRQRRQSLIVPLVLIIIPPRRLPHDDRVVARPPLRKDVVIAPAPLDDHKFIVVVVVSPVRKALDGVAAPLGRHRHEARPLGDVDGRPLLAHLEQRAARSSQLVLELALALTLARRAAVVLVVVATAPGLDVDDVGLVVAPRAAVVGGHRFLACFWLPGMGRCDYELVALLPALCNSRRRARGLVDYYSSGKHSCGSDVWLDGYGASRASGAS